MIQAIKPVFDRKTQSFNVSHIPEADVLLAHDGWLVYDNPQTTLDAIDRGALLGNWTPKKRAAAATFLGNQLLAALPAV